MDDADRAQAEIERSLDTAMAAARGVVVPGEPGECEECGDWFPRVVAGLCARCREWAERRAALAASRAQGREAVGV